MESIIFHKLRRHFILGVFLLFSFTSFSQKITSFSEETNTFLSELDIFLSQTKNDELKQISKKISKSFDKGEISSPNQKIIRNISNLMLEKKMKSTPYFRDFLSVVIQLKDDEINKSKLSDWLTVSENIVLNFSSRQLLKYCEFSSSFLSAKTLRNSKSVKWHADCNTFYFKDNNGVPYVHFISEIDLSCSNRNGSFQISDTKGKYWIQNNKFEGIGGRVDWKDRGWSSDSVYANLSIFSIDVKESQFKADSVHFYNNKSFSFPVIGEFLNKAVSGSSAEHYPVFKSYKKDIVLYNILPDVDYKGGYTLRGKDFIADGIGDASARIIINKNGKKILVANSARFSIKKNIIYSESAAIKLYFDEDSMYHPSLQFTYSQSERKLKLYRDKKGVSGAPIYNSYHQLTIDAELIEWQIDEENILLGSLPSTSVSNVNFESIASYNDELYHSLRGIDKVNPLMRVSNFVKSSGTTNFSSAEFADYAGYPLHQIEPYLMNLSNKGFLFYDVSTNRAEVQEKLYNYINSRLQLADYDVIRFKSEVTDILGDNMIVHSRLNISTKDLNINGVESIDLSNTRQVYIKPYNRNIKVKKNRDFDFSGRVSVGNERFVLYGKDFNFKYDDFRIDLKQIDSVQLSVPIEPYQFDKYGEKRLVRIQTVIQSVTGDLRIDEPTNKSGIRKDSFPQFPIFKSFDDSYAYYDKPSTFGGVYNRENFSFHLDTFEIDSLESFDGKGLRFPGTFESANIFPIFQDTLTMMRDYSLGFKTRTPTEGYEMYGGRSKYFNEISLSNDGLLGSGDFEYLNSRTKSKEIYFFPDSTALFTQDFLLTKVEIGIEFPQVDNTEAFGLYQPYNERYKVSKMQTPFNFYDNLASFDGNVVLRPTGLTGEGSMSLENLEMESKLFSYNANWFAADTANLTGFTEQKEISFKSNDLQTHIDLKDRTGDFFSNGRGSSLELLANQYICYVDKFHWDMDEELLTLGDLDESLGGSKFVSIHPKQDSLSFIAKTSTFNIKDNIISVQGVNEILVADAAIYPSNESFFVEKNAFIPTIISSRILVNTATKHHEFTNASVNIEGGDKYTASGDYTYKDVNGNDKYIFFNEISVNEVDSTVAVGSVGNNEVFNIGSKFIFKGDVNLRASKRLLTFDGFFKIDNKCDLISEEWVGFKSEINPKIIKFKLDTLLRNDEGDKLSSGILMNLESPHMYTSFLSLKERPIDVEIVSANTYLNYDKRTSSFVIQGEDSLSNIFTINENTCKSNAEGVIDLNMDFGQLKMKSIGFVNRDEKDNKTELHMFLILDFMFNEDALSLMAEDILQSSLGTDFVFREFYSKTLSRLVGKSRSEELMFDIEALDEFKDLPKELDKTITFTDIILVWSDKHQAYISKGKIGVGNIYQNQLNTVMDGWVRLSKKEGMDVLTILLKTGDGDIYFFEYENNTMYSYRSSDPLSDSDDFNNLLIEMKPKKRRAEEGKGEPPYIFKFCHDEDRMEDFEREMRKID